MKTKLDIIKIGGNLIDDELLLSAALNNFKENKNLKILVHGGGKQATILSHKLGIQPQMIEGRRVTSVDDLEAVIMVYAGLINKQIVANLQHLNCNAIGLSGCDLNSITSKKRQDPIIDYGFVGDIENINILNIELLLKDNFIPVFSAITHDGNAQLLNTNADTIAAQLAIALASIYEVRLLYCFEKNGVLSDPANENSVIPNFDKSTFEVLKETGFISAGMIPKLDNCFYALENGVRKIIIGNSGIINESTQLFTKLSL